MSENGALHPSVESPESPELVRATETVVEIWAEVLDIEPAGIDAADSDFFELGGYSLLALLAIGRILAAHGVDPDQERAVELEGLLLNQLFETPTAIAQAACLVEALAG